MEFFKREPIIFLIAGKARSGKSTVSELIKSEYINKKVIISPLTKYLKKYIEEIIGDKIDEDNKPRELLQKISSDVIKEKLGMNNFFIDRAIEDLKIYSYFFDIIIIPDVRFESEINEIKKEFKNVISIGVVREDYISDLTVEEQNDITEVSLDNYNKYDYKIINKKDTELSLEVVNILKNVERRYDYE